MSCRNVCVGALIAVLLCGAALHDANALTQAEPRQGGVSEYETWFTTCQDEGADPDKRITACTAVLNAGREDAGNEAMLLTNRGMARFGKGEHDVALMDFDQAIGRDPTADFAYFSAGVVYEDLGQYDKAIRAYDNVLRLNPTDAAALNNRCWARVLSFDAVWALPDCEESLRLAPNDPDTLDTRGFAYLQLGRHDDAIASFTAAITARANQPTAFYGRALAHMATNHGVEAAADLAQARRIDPDIDQKFRRWGMQADNLPCAWPGACPKR